MKVAHAEDSAQINSVRGAEREFKTLLTGDDIDYALVGAVDVAMPNVHDHLARMGFAPDAPLKLSEGSAW